MYVVNYCSIDSGSLVHTKTPAAISRNNRQNPSEQPQPSALRRERERNKRHTHRRVRQEKKYP